MYGFLISVSILSCILVAKKLARKDGEIIWNLSFWSVVSGIAGARLYHVVSDFDLYRDNLLNIFLIYRGGFGIWGAIIGGAVGALIYLWKHNKPFWYWLDIMFTVLPLGQAIGRWGNYFNKEIYGSLTDLPWGITINNEKHHPLFLYESSLDLLNFFTLIYLYTKTKLSDKKGTFTFLYLINYSVIRFVMELCRQDRWVVSGLNVSLLIPILLFMTALCCLVRIHRRNI